MPSPQVSDEPLDPERWVHEHGDYLLTHAMMRLRDRARAEDAVQDTLMTALSSKQSFRGESSERTWLTGILRNKIFESLRKLAREATHQAPEWPADDADYDARGHLRPDRFPAQFSLAPEHSLERDEFAAALRLCMEELPDQTGQAFVAVELDRRDLGAVAEALKVKKNNLYVLLHRARKRLRACLEKGWFAEQPSTSPPPRRP